MKAVRAVALGVSLATLAFHSACGSGGGPTAPGRTPETAGWTGSGGVRSQNVAPTLVLQTTPPASGNVISGFAPLKVLFNLCRSSDPDTNDSLNWQFHFGDSPTTPFRPDGTFNPDAEHTCRTEHVYEAGRYTATVSVTDKHLEDQGKGAVALARKTQQLIVDVSSAQAPGGSDCTPTGATVSTSFDSFAPGTAVEALTVPGVTFASGGTATIMPSFFASLTGMVAIQFNAPGDITFNFASDRDGVSMNLATPFPFPVTMAGFNASNAQVFSVPFTGSDLGAGYAEGVVASSGSPPFRRVVLSTGGFMPMAFDNLVATPVCQ